MSIPVKRLDPSSDLVGRPSSYLIRCVMSIARRLNVYLEQLPEYQDRISFVFERK